MDTESENYIKGIQDEARREFSLRDRLANKSNRRKTVSIYTDAEVGAELGYAEDEVLPNGLTTGRRVRKGLVGQLDELKVNTELALKYAREDDPTVAKVAQEFEEKSADLKSKIRHLTERLEESALEFTLQTVPPVLIRGERRKARADLDINTKGIPEALEEAFALRFQARILSASVVRWKDNLSGEEFSELTIEQAEELANYLPQGQFARLDNAVAELSYEVAIGNAATDSPDF